METPKQTKALRLRQHELTSNTAVAYQKTAQLTSPCPPDVERFIHEALTKRKPSLIPFATISQSVAEMAKYLKRHCSGSHATAYLYIWSIHQYCKWCGADPDQLINECLSEDGCQTRRPYYSRLED